jgi:hypothetical protein
VQKKWVTRSGKTYINGMYVRKKKNRSGSTSVVIVDKGSGNFRHLKTIGISSEEKVIFDNLKRILATICAKRDFPKMANTRFRR